MRAKITSYATAFICLLLSGCVIPGKTVAIGDGLTAKLDVLGTQAQLSAGTGGVVDGVTGLVGSLSQDLLYVAGNAPLLSQLGETGATNTAMATAGGLVDVLAPNAANAPGGETLAKATDTSVLTAFVPGDQGAESLRITQDAQQALSAAAGAVGATSGGGASGGGAGGAVAGAAGAVGSTVSQILGSAGGGSGGLLGGLLP